MKELIGDYEAFLTSIAQVFEKIGIAKAELVMCDHLCYRVATEERYQQMRELLSNSAQDIGEVPVSGRLITTFELDQPLRAAGWSVPCIELPAPKDGSPYSEGLEHAEFVVPNLQRFMQLHSELPFNTAALTKQINPELGLKMSQHRLSVKFHEIALGAVVRLERRLETK